MVLGCAIECWDADLNCAVPVDEPGELVCTKPFPSMPVRFWNDPESKLYHAAYFDKIPGKFSIAIIINSSNHNYGWEKNNHMIKNGKSKKLCLLLIHQLLKLIFGCRTTKMATSNDWNCMTFKKPCTILSMQNVDGVPIG